MGDFMVRLLDWFWSIPDYIVTFSNWIWGIPLLFLLLGGGIFFLIYSRCIPFLYLGHTVRLLTRKRTEGLGQISGYQALSTALASTVGMGNIAGVAVAITGGGPGAIFWMWITAFLGMTTNFFTCTLSSMFRGRDSHGEIQGGPMYVIVEGLGKAWKPLGILFSFCCLLGMLPIFQANQLTQAIRDVILVPAGITGYNLTIAGIEIRSTDLITGAVFVSITSFIVFGGITRIGQWAARMVPLMVVIYFICVLYILLTHLDKLTHYIFLIFDNAFTAENFDSDTQPIFGGALGGLIVLGARRASFSNEAGLGTLPMAMGAAKTVEPIEEGLIAMVSPAIDTLIVCTCTALTILVTDTWQNADTNGVSLTAHAFSVAIPGLGPYLLMTCIFFFGITSIFSYCYYGVKSTGFILGAKRAHWYNYFYIITILVGATSSLQTVMSFLDATYAMMAIPTMFSGIVLSPHVIRAFKAYREKHK